MPGNIRVAVLEAVDLPATVTAGKSVAVKVAVGKREFQTILAEAQDGRTQPWNSEFLFPVLNLSDNLLVAIMNSKGEMVAKAELETPGIVQKGFQDAFLAMKAGGRIHVKVSFVLSEEERKKIEAMRLISLKKRKTQPARPQTGRPRQSPVSNVKITEITSEDSSGPGSVATCESTTEKAKPDVTRPINTNEQAPKPSQIPTSPELKEDSTNLAATEKTPVRLVTDNTTNENKRKGFSWFTANQKPLEPSSQETAQAAAEGSRWLEGLKQKSKNDQVRANRADEWIKSLDAQRQGESKPGPGKILAVEQEGLRLKMQLQEEDERLQRMEEKTGREEKVQKSKSVKQRLEDWKLKELGPWRRSTSRVRHASPSGCEQLAGCKKIRWLTRKVKADQVTQDHGLAASKEDLMAAADSMWASTIDQHSSSQNPASSEQDKKRSGGLKGAVKQVLNGVGAVIWPRKKKQEKYHIVKEGETLRSIVPEEWDNPDSKFFHLNPRLRESGLVYPGQRLRLH